MFRAQRLLEARPVPQLSPDLLPDHLDSMLRSARAMTSSREDAEDLVQETLVRVLARRRELAAGAAAGPYLHQALRNTYVSGLRARDRRPRTALTPVEDLHLTAPSGAEPAAVVATREVLGAIAALPTAQREVVTAVDVAGFGYREAAAALRIPIGTVMSRLHRARARLAPQSPALA
jgi:RNA polymerase sigma-70 factor (ECF subfamily)